MLPHNHISQLGAVLFVALAGFRATAQEVPVNADYGPPPTLQGSLRSGEVVGVEQVRRAYLAFGTNRFAFVMPSGFRMDASNPEKIVLTDSNYSCFLTVRVAGRPTGQEVELETGRELVLNQHPGATILEQFLQSAANRSGPAFDLQWEASNGSMQSARVAFIPSAAGILEFSVLSKPDKFAESKHMLNFLMLTFRSNEGGKLEMPVFSDKS